MKKCSKCKKQKDFVLFSKNPSHKYGYANECKSCKYEFKKKWYKTKDGIITDYYHQQKSRSKKRGHQMPDYTKEELKSWCFNQDIFHELHKQWKESGYPRHLRPSVDRIDNKIGYTIKNIQIMTARENLKKH